MEIEMNVLKRYAQYLDSEPERISELFAVDGYFFDGGMKLVGRDKCHFVGREEIHANFTRPNRPRTPVAGVLINGNAMRYNVKAGDSWIEAVAIVLLNEDGFIQSYVTQCRPANPG
ncbi:hypothetical protein K3M67_05860 [Sphingobium sp. V4]|uniref:hypothetical protein n=1 Tax=Sphingobium sp. V4 TaxID=3038927 RepID=UPI002557D8A1|nr:hypothetical protein [Sphingobium sp. V4]WIW89485.1 hypothetical protein K3M67_05860 [Sphingobium sp. V4]